MNDPIDVANLPQLDDGDFVGVNPKYLTVVAIPYLVVMALSGAATVAAAVLLSPWLILAGLAMIVILGLAILARRLAFPHLGYLAREHDFSIRFGLISRSVTTIPFKRIQNSVVRQGPLERHFGLASLTISSARGAIGLPGLLLEDANKLRAFVAENAALDSEGDMDGA